MIHNILLVCMLMLAMCCHGQQYSQNCYKNYSLYKEFMKVGSYDLATGPFWELVDECPGFRESVYDDGVRIYNRMAAHSSSEELRISYLDTVGMVLKRKVASFGNADGECSRYLSLLLRYYDAQKLPVWVIYNATADSAARRIDKYGVNACKGMYPFGDIAIGYSDGSLAEFCRRFAPGGRLPESADSLLRLKLLMETYNLYSCGMYRALMERIYSLAPSYMLANEIAVLYRGVDDRKTFAYYRNEIELLLRDAPQRPEYYFVIATVYYQNTHLCGGDDFEKQCAYWVAADYAARAKSAGYANPMLDIILRGDRFPDKSEAFMRSILPGTRVEVRGFLTEYTTARF